MNIILVALVLGLVLILFATFLSFDRVVRRQYTEHYESWCHAGRPFGMFWKPEHVGLFRGSLAFYKASAVWLFVTPSWAVEDPFAVYLLRRYRAMVITWNASILLFFALVAIAQARAG